MKRLLIAGKVMTVAILLGLIAGISMSADEPGRTGRNFKDCAMCPEMVVIPPGTFIMGSPENEKYREDDERQHRVTIDYSFAVSKAPITWDQWEACARDAMCDGQAVETALRKANQGKPETEEYEDYGRGNRPVIGVSWWDAQAFVGWLNKKTGKDKYRLLSESEYEYAARAGTATAYWWGKEPSHEYANYGREAEQELGGAVEGRDIWGDETSPVCSFPVNGFGLCDMAGNVYQWIEDCYEADGAKLPTDGSAVRSGNCNVRGFRGNSFMSDPKSLRSANRAFVYSPDSRGRSYLGIRVAKTID
jgi:formylglycine-generating enzyme required for sulfatase activity